LQVVEYFGLVLEHVHKKGIPGHLESNGVFGEIGVQFGKKIPNDVVDNFSEISPLNHGVHHSAFCRTSIEHDIYALESAELIVWEIGCCLGYQPMRHNVASILPTRFAIFLFAASCP